MFRLVRCACGKVVKVSPAPAGQAARCPACGAVVQPPPALPARPAAGEAAPLPSSQTAPSTDGVRPVVRHEPPPLPSSSSLRVPEAAAAISPARSLTADRRREGVGWLALVAFAGVSATMLGLLGFAFLKSGPGAPVVPVVSDDPGPPPESKPKIVRSTRDIVAGCEASVAKIEGKLSQGTGFLAAPGIVATNAHVIDQELIDNLKVSFPSAPQKAGRPVRARLISKDSPRDLALLEVESSLAPLVLARGNAFQRGEDIVIIGNPEGLGGRIALENAVTRGVLSTEARFLGQRWYQLSTSVNPGNSGGPVIDTQGRVVGIVTLKASQEEGHSYCIPVDALIAGLDEAAGISPDRRRRVERRHETQSVFRVFRLLGEKYAVASLLFVAAERARLDDSDNADGLSNAYEQARRSAQRLDDQVRADYTTALHLTLEDPRTDEAIGENLERLRRLVDRLRDALERANGTDPDEFDRACSASVDEHKALVERLARELDVPQD